MYCENEVPASAKEHLEILGRKAYEKCIPLNIHLELTNHCNLRCIHCYVVEEKRKELTYKEITRLLDQLADEGSLYLTLTGGEILTRGDFFEIAHYAKKKHFAMRLFTNGTLITEDIADKIAEISPLTVEISIYSANPEIHDSITGVGGSFQKSINTIELLKKRGITIILKTVLMKQNIAGLKEVFKFGKGLNIEDHQFDVEICPKNDGSEEPLKYQLDGNELLNYFSGDIPQKWEFIEDVPWEQAVKKATCAPATIGCAISSYGDVYPCSILKLPLGNIREKSFKEIWYSNSPQLRKVRSIKSYADLPECSNCPIVWHCRRCHGKALSFMDNFESKYELACKIAAIMKEVNGRTKNKEVVNERC